MSLYSEQAVSSLSYQGGSQIDTQRLSTPQGEWKGRAFHSNSQVTSDSDISTYAVGLFQDSFDSSAISRLDYFLTMVTTEGMVRVTGVTRMLPAYEAFVKCLERIRAIPAVKGINVDDVIHACGPKDDVVSDLEPQMISFIEKLEASYALNLGKYWVLKTDVVNGGVRIRGRVEFADEYAKFEGCTAALHRATAWRRSKTLDISGVTTSSLTTAMALLPR